MVKIRTIYGATWCHDTKRTRKYLDEKNIPYLWVDIDKDTEGEKFVIEINKGKRRIPTILFDDETVMSVPTNEELSEKLGISQP
ncbi:MAG: glutaredoxin family protein [Candidatus Heimdallarchaeaceae archaeon]